MSSADIPIFAELELLREKWAEELAEAEADLRQWASRAENMSIEIPVRLKDEFTAPLDKIIQDAQGRTVIVPVQFVQQGAFPGAPGGGGGGVPGAGGNTYDFSTSSFQATLNQQQNNLFQQIDQSVNQTLNQTFAQYQAAIDQSTTNIVNNYARAGGGGGGGGGLAGIGLGRHLGPFALIHALTQVVGNQERYGEALQAAGADPLAIERADLGERRGFDSLLFGVGRLGRGIRENVIAPFTGEATTASIEGQQAEQRTIDRRIALESRADDEQRRVSGGLYVAEGPSARERERREDEVKEREAIRKVREQEGERLKAINDATNDEAARAGDRAVGFFGRGSPDPFGNWQRRYNAASDAVLDQHREADSRQGAAIRRQAEEEQAAIRKETEERHRIRDEQDARETATLRERGQEAALRLAGDPRAAEILRLGSSLDKERAGLVAQYGQASDQVRAFDAGRPAIQQEGQDQIARRERFADESSAARVRGIESGTGEAQMRLRGEVRGAGDEAYHRSLQEEIDLLRRRADATNDNAEKQRLLNQARAQEQAMPVLERLRKQAEDWQEASGAFAGVQTRRDIEVSVEEARLGAAGNRRGASDAEFQRQLDRRHDELLQASRDPTIDNATRTQREQTARAFDESEPELRTAHRQQEELDDADAVRDIQARSHADQLKEQGNFYEAQREATKVHYESLIREAERNKRFGVADALRDEEAQALRTVDAQRQRQTDRMNRRASDVEAGNDPRRRGITDVLEFQHGIDQEIEDAQGDPARQRAIMRRGAAEARQRAIAMQRAPEMGTMQHFEDMLQLAQFDPAAGAAARQREGFEAVARDLNRRGMNAGRQPPVRNAEAGAVRDAGRAAADAAANPFGPAVEKFSRATDKWEKLVDGSLQLVVVGG